MCSTLLDSGPVALTDASRDGTCMAVSEELSHSIGMWFTTAGDAPGYEADEAVARTTVFRLASSGQKSFVALPGRRFQALSDTRT